MDTAVEHVTSNYDSIADLIATEVANRVNQNPFYIINLQDINYKYSQWSKLLPRIKPFYAVKCNNMPEVVTYLSMLGTGFDCASRQEIDQVLKLGVSPSSIIYANPCKHPLFIKYAAASGVTRMTFDNEYELRKIASINSAAELVLRIKGDDSHSLMKLNSKFGARFDDCKSLLSLAKELKLNVIGVSFHNGSNCEDPIVYQNSVALARQVFELGKLFGYSMYLLDIGGGFPGYDKKGGLKFEQYASVINQAIEKYFPSIDVQTGEKTFFEVIAEPGRYFVASSFHLVSMIIAKKVEFDFEKNKTVYSYYMNDGVYGGFTNTLLDHEVAVPKIVKIKHPTKNNTDYKLRQQQRQESSCTNDSTPIKQEELHSTTLWGPTCDSMDCIRKDFMFPELEIGQWISFENMGAYTVCIASSFNGFDKATAVVAI